MNKGIFITGTDTGVGKTFISGLLARHLKQTKINFTIIKPFASGCKKENNKLVSEDCIFLKSFIPLNEKTEKISIINYELALSPLAASLESGKKWNKKQVLNTLLKIKKKFEFIIVEGIGGILTPLKHKYYVSDLIKDLDYPVLIVARPSLGTLNHTLLTINKLENDNAKITGIIFNSMIKDTKDISIKQNAKIIEKESGYKVLATIPYFNNFKNINYKWDKKVIDRIL